MIEPAERAGMRAGLDVRRFSSMERRAWATLEPWAPMKAWAAAVEVVVIDERAAVRNPVMVVVLHPPAAPVGVPVVPSPAESGVVADPETESERDPRADGVQAGERIPAWVSHERGAIDDPRVVGGDVDDLR